LFSDLVCSDLVERVVLKGEFLLEDDVSSPDNPVKCRYLDAIDIR
jgi:hypothetical protein